MKFQLIDIDYIFNTRPVVRMFGRTEKGNAVCVFYDKFYPYFYAYSPNLDKAISEMEKIKEIRDFEIVEKFLPTGYHDKKQKMLKIVINNPQNVPAIKEELISKGIIEKAYDADILFKYRFMVDHGIHGMQWIDADCHKSPSNSVTIPSYYAESFKPLEENKNTNLKYLSVDIECVPIDPKKPFDANNLKIIIISLAFYPEFDNKNTLVLIAKPFSSKNVKGFPDEKEMLKEFLKIVEFYDPDIITGYNINSFDIPTLIEAFKRNKLLPLLGRCRTKQAYTKTFGITHESVVPGRVVVDPYQILKRDPWVKFHRYDLNTVAKEMLGEGKDDVEYHEIETLWNGNKDEMTRLIEYSRKDADLVLRLLLEKRLLDKFFELSKISGVTLQDSFGGQSMRIETMILHEFAKRNYVMPQKPTGAELSKRMNERKELKGAIVLEPKKGLHTDGCILVLDFKSLYPSIMRTYNISPDTLMLEDKNVKYNTSPLKTKFVDESVKRGVFPELLTRLMNARSEAKKQMKMAKGEKKRVLNARQLALKDISNSFYGYTGYIRARLYMLDVAKSITAFGRENIENTKRMVEEKFKLEVVYGDTDSIFLKTNEINLDKAMQLGKKISEYVTNELPGVLELEFEKIYRTFLILTKKRYVGWSFSFEDGEWKDKIEMKGIETVRRDWCPLVSELMLEIINIILKKGDLKSAIEKVRDVIEKLKRNEIPIEKLTIIKGITKNIQSYDGVLPHIELAKKMAERNPQNAPQIGDRIGFVIIKGNEMLSKRAEDPNYVKENNIEIDSEYYIYNQILPPIERIFAAAGVTKSEIFGMGRQVSLGDIVNGTKHTMKREIFLDYNKDYNKNKSTDKASKKSLDGWEGFVCDKCGKRFRRMPLSGSCECGGNVLIFHNGNTGDKVVIGTNFK